MAANDIGIDLGTTNSYVYHAGRGMVIKEPTVVVYDRNAERIRYFGEEAMSMTDRLTGDLELIRPIREGVIMDYFVMEKMLRNYIGRAMGRQAFRKPRISICIPSSITEIGRKALMEAAYQSGARKVYLVEAPVAAGVGVGLDLTRPSGNMVVDIGSGTTDAAVISMGSVVVSASAKVGGDAFTRAIVTHLRKEYNLFIGEETAERIKVSIGSAVNEKKQRTMDVHGRNVTTGLPKTVVFSNQETSVAVQEVTGQVVDLITSILEKTPPELASDIVDRGIILTGGGALLSGMDMLVEQKTEISTMTATDPMAATVIGTCRYPDLLTATGRE